MRSLIFCLLLFNPVFSQEPEPAPIDDQETRLVISVQEECVVGELVRFSAEDSTVSGIKWQIIPETKDFEVIENGRRAFFSSRVPGKYLVIVAGAEGGKPFLDHFHITVLGEAVPPGPPTLGMKIGQWYQQTNSPNKKEEALRIASVFQTLSTTEIEVDKILAATAVANREALGDSLQNWVPFLDALGEELDVFVQEGHLGSREQYQQVWQEIAVGLQKAIRSS